MKYGIIVAMAILMIMSCSYENRFDPTTLNDGFKGITYTDDAARILGPVDPTDWNFGPINSLPIALRPANEDRGVPSTFGARAYPNPASDSITIELAMPVYFVVSIAIVDDHYRIIKKFRSFQEAGVHQFVWDLRDENGRKVQSDIYRVYYRFGDLIGGYGDIWIRY